MRAQEALKLDWRDVEEDRRRLIIADSKTGGFAKIIGPRLAAMLTEWRDGRGKGALFPVNDLTCGAGAGREGGRQGDHAARSQANVRLVRRARGRADHALKVLMNHSTRGDITMGYVRPSEADLLHWAERIEGLILSSAESGAIIPFDRASGA